MFDVWESIHQLGQQCLIRAVTEPAIDSEGVVKDSILRSIDRLLWDEVESAVFESRVRPFQHDSLYTADKWLTTSALQKCIRRGHSELAERYVRSGVRIDADHTFRRLAIIALEDVGLGDLKLIATTLAILGNKLRRRSLGEERLAVHLAVQMSRAIKSRLSCEMLSLVEYDNEAGKIAERVSGLDAVALSNIVQSEDFGSTRQLVSLWLLHGTDRLRSRQLVSIAGQGQRGLLRLLIDQSAPLIFHYIVRMGLSRCRDSLALPYVLLAKFADQNPLLCTVRGETPRPTLIGSYPYFAYDMHTRIGRRAIKEFEFCFGEEVRSMGVRDVGNLVFALEGGLLDERVIGCGADDIHQTSTCLEVFEQRHLGSDIGNSFADLTSNLQEIRRRAAVSA
ncbi:hypothetical protein K3165_03805 [Qipengyuania sp. 1XM1-15A]|uniref:hypothetical protein n=1 Tax=Qipengyuania xiamenensis TaxID=2867237 RepID=UPI001C88D7AC|nr:hypothetical protein [Qipengyuania xiamenensis]MBX7532047.1 hypothetical protein [Qipengyuania xiamenensis]